jgi:glycosyltransferase involved in cell wall biosynthesis
MRPARPTVAAIVAAYNEEQTIGAVVRTLVASRLFRDVIVVSDGSVDRTADIARAEGASLVHQFPTNKGKGDAMRYGVSQTDADILLFCDADLIGLTPQHLHQILDPVVEGRYAMNIGLIARGPLLTRLERHLPLISGQRALRREIFESLPEAFFHGYMIETGMNRVCRYTRQPRGVVVLHGLDIRHKMQKVGFFSGVIAYLRMGYHILRAYSIARQT